MIYVISVDVLSFSAVAEFLVDVLMRTQEVIKQQNIFHLVQRPPDCVSVVVFPSCEVAARGFHTSAYTSPRFPLGEATNTS